VSFWRRQRLLALDHAQLAVVDVDVEREHVLAVVDLPAAWPSRTTTRSPTAQMLRPESGIVSGRWLRRSSSARFTRRAGTLACVSARAVRSTIRSWNENRYCRAVRARALRNRRR
jgi:hypothetical protein